jgi:hypothetical protein
MKKNRTLSKFVLILGLALVTFGCITNKAGTPIESISVKAEAVPEGICLTFDNIPPEASYVFITLHETPDIFDYLSSFTRIRDSELKQLKETKKVKLPFVKPGKKYEITAVIIKDDYPEGHKGGFINREWEFYAYAECTPYAGAYFYNNVEFNLDEKNSSVTLSTEPNFPQEIIFAKDKYNFYAHIVFEPSDILRKPEGEDSQYYGNELIWNYSAMYDFYKTWLAGGEYHGYVKAACNIIYDNLKWEVEIAKSKRISFSL